MGQEKGKLHLILETEQVTEKFRKREFILEIGDKYKEYPKFQLVNDKCSLIEHFIEGQEVTVSYNLRGKPFKNKQGQDVYYTNLDAWKIEIEGSQKNNVPLPKDKDAPPPAADLPKDTDDLPF
jgi:single-strand DNA-binding protein